MTSSIMYISKKRQIWTGQLGKKSRVEAMVVDAKGKISFVGSALDCVAAHKNVAHVIQKTVNGSIVAGGVDSHNHFWYGLLAPMPSLENCNNVEDVINLINKYKDTADILFVRNAMDYHKITLEMLDQFSQPLIVLHRSFHMAYVNSAAKKLRQLQNIPDWIDNWRVHNCMYHLLRADMFDDEYISKSFQFFERELLQQGIVCVHDLLVHDIDYLPFFEKLQIKHCLYGREKVIRDAIEQNKLHFFTGVKSFIDGAIGSKTAKFAQSYCEEATSGKFYISSDTFLKDIDLALENNLQTACHGIGSEGIRRIIKTLRKRTVKDPRIEHFECPYIEDIDIFQSMGGYASLQPNFGQDYRDYQLILGKRVELINPFRYLIDRGFCFGTGSDGMPSGFRECLLWCISPYCSSQKMTLEEAVHYSTIGAAKLANQKAGLLPNQPANFVCFTKPLESLYSYPYVHIDSNWQNLRQKLDALLPIDGVYVNGQLCL